jgi:uncharacterized glyoxalase superfamily protein PhnB
LIVELEAGLVCRDGQVMEAFCRDVLGFELTARLQFPGTGTVVKLRRGAARIKLFVPEGPVRAAEPASPWFEPGGWRYAAVYLSSRAEVDDLASAAVAAGGRVVVAPAQHRPGACAALVTDPEGNAWELLWEDGGSD